MLIGVPVGHGVCFVAAQGPRESATTVVTLPGSGDVDHDGLVGVNRPLRQFGHALAASGLRVLRVSKARSGERRPHRSFRDEYLWPVEAVISRECTGESRVVLLGHSLGGHVAPWLGRQLPRVGGVVMLNPPVSPLSEIVGAQFGDVVEPARALQLAGATPEYWRAAADMRFENELRSLRVPSLVVSCGNDGVLPRTERVLLRAVARRVQMCEWYSCRGANHLGMSGPLRERISEMTRGRLDERIVRRVRNWIAERVEAAILPEQGE